VVNLVRVRAEHDFGSFTDKPVHHPDTGNGPAIPVIVGIEYQRTEGRIETATRAWNTCDDRLQQLWYAGPLFGRNGEYLLSFRSNQVHDLLGTSLWLCTGQVDLVENRDDLQAGVHGEKQVAERLRLDALRGVDHQDRTLAGGERSRDLIGEIHVARRVDEIELVLTAVGRGVAHPNGIQLDGDPALALQIHRIEQLLAHLTLFDGPSGLDEPVCERGLPMIDVGDDAEVPDFGL
jgi:hypothetical protein